MQQLPASRSCVLCNDTDTGLRAVIAIHSTALGPATGGLRMWTYASEEDAIFDALRLARGMTYKYAAAGVNLGGGKAVIIGDPKTDKTEALMRAMGRFIDQLGGEYITGEDVGTTLDDMETAVHRDRPRRDAARALRRRRRHLARDRARLGAGDEGACAQRVWGTPDLAGRTVALQGLGVCRRRRRCELLVDEGAEVRRRPMSTRTRSPPRSAEHGVTAVAPDEIYDQDVDIFAPYALGARHQRRHDRPRLRCQGRRRRRPTTSSPTSATATS